MKILTLIPRIALCISVMLFLAFLVMPRFYNNWKIGNFVQSLELIQLPEETELIASGSKFGVLGGTSNYCAVEAFILAESPLKPEDFLAELPKTLILDTPYTNEESYPLIYTRKDDHVYRVDQSGPEELTNMDYSNPGSKRNLMSIFDSYAPEKQENIYIIMVEDMTSDGYATFDPRCN